MGLPNGSTVAEDQQCDVREKPTVTLYTLPLIATQVVCTKTEAKVHTEPKYNSVLEVFGLGSGSSHS